MPLRHPLLCALLVLAAAQLWTRSEVRHGPGPVAPSRPAQRPATAAPFEHHGARVIPRADYQVQARVLATERYFLDPMADLSPIDVALGWGPMSDERVLDKLDVSQGQRFVYIRPRERLPISRTLFHLTFSNVHAIAASPHIERALKSLRKGQVVRLNGWLVDVERPGLRPWRTSLERGDYGNGACEILYTTGIELL